MNIYRYKFVITCPNNGKDIDYELEIRSDSTIMVESIIAAGDGLPDTGYHEEIADRMASMLPGYHIIRAHHHGVDIETHREGKDDE